MTPRQDSAITERGGPLSRPAGAIQATSSERRRLFSIPPKYTLSVEGQGLSTVNGNAASARDNPHLFKKLAKVLRDGGKPQPTIIDYTSPFLQAQALLAYFTLPH